jgi:hypothetical protein
MVFGAVIVFDVVTTLGGAASATLGSVAVPIRGTGITGDGVSGWPDMIPESCRMADRCFIFSLAFAGMVPWSCSKITPAACRVWSCLGKTGIWQ